MIPQEYTESAHIKLNNSVNRVTIDFLFLFYKQMSMT
jgi:hypothetical protein